MASAANVDVAGIFLNTQERVKIRLILMDMGHPQPSQLHSEQITLKPKES